MSNSVVEWYRPGAALDAATVTRTVLGIVFEGIGAGGR
jgi:hypothetical protein